MHRRILTALVPGVLTALLGLAACQSDEGATGPNPPTVDPLMMGGLPGDTGGGGGCGDAGCEAPSDRMTGGGKLDQVPDFATFGFQVRLDRGQFEWVQHCLTDAPSAPNCEMGDFSFHGNTVTSYGPAAVDPEVCRTWTGSGVLKSADGTESPVDYTVERACDYGEPGTGTDYISFSVAGYHREGVLSGGNLQLHPVK